MTSPHPALRADLPGKRGGDLVAAIAGVAPNGIELHAVLSICFPGSSVSGCSVSTPDFRSRPTTPTW